MLLSRIITISVKFNCLQKSEPAKIISCIFPTHKFLTNYSPNTQRIASMILLLLILFGLITNVILFSKSMTVLSAKDLNSVISICFKHTKTFLLLLFTVFPMHSQQQLVLPIFLIYLVLFQSTFHQHKLQSKKSAHEPVLLH